MMHKSSKPVVRPLSARLRGERVGVRWVDVRDEAPPTSPSHAYGAGPSLSPLKGGEGNCVGINAIPVNSLQSAESRSVSLA